MMNEFEQREFGLIEAIENLVYEYEEQREHIRQVIKNPETSQFTKAYLIEQRSTLRTVISDLYAILREAA